LYCKFIKKKLSKFFIGLGYYVRKGSKECMLVAVLVVVGQRRLTLFLCLVRQLIICNREACVWHHASNVGQVGAGL